ncbi:MAG: hypothetical protein FWE49_01450 [Synergistaceae bacterium]|nr:hypothetical protein [Synergistaceae bacterium]
MPNYENLKLFRIIEKDVKQIDASDKRSSRSPQKAYLVPFKMLSVSGFKFPFSNPVRIREAIKLQTVSYSSGSSIQIFPVHVNRSSKETSGFSFFLPDNELTEFEEITENTSAPVFPAPLSLASSVNGNGITVWTDEKNICSVVWRSGIPELYRWRVKRESAIDSEINWLKKYCESKEIEENRDVFVFDAENDSGNFLSIMEKSFASFPWLREINLSRGVINSVMILERFVRFASKAAVWLTIFGIIFAAGAWLNYSMISKALADVGNRSEKLYREAFDKEGRIVDAVSQARGRINALQGSGKTGKALSEALSDLGIPWRNNTIKITIDSMSYNTERAELVGSAVDMATIQSFRTSLAEMGRSVQLGDVSQIPGGGFRFNLVIRWE